MAIAYGDIARVLRRARRRRAWIVAGTAFGFGAAAAVACLLGGLLVLGKGLGPVEPVRAVAVALSLAAVLGASGWAVAAVLRGASTPVAVARTLAAGVPELRSDLVSAVELEEEYEEVKASGRYSVALVDAHVARTAERARDLDLERLIPGVAARRAGAAFLFACVAAAVAVAIAPRTLAAGWRRLAGAAGPAAARRVEPITGDIQITYAYPAYMKREPKVLSGTGGDISAPRGTEVTLETRADRPVTTAEIVLTLGDAAIAAEPLARGEGERSGTQRGEARPPGEKDGARGSAAARSREGADSSSDAAPGPSGPAGAVRVYQLTVKNGRELSGRFVLEQGGSYRFRFTRGRKVVAEGPPLPIAVEPDAFPEVRITAPVQEVEVDARARVHVEWNASDDVGLNELVLVTKPPQGEERRTLLRGWNGNARHEAGSHELDLAPMRLAEGERLLYWLEVTDNDTVSGPKRAASATNTVKIYSEAEHHRAALAKAQRLWEEMISLLGDRLAFFDATADAPASAGPGVVASAPSRPEAASSPGRTGAWWTSERVAQASTLDQRTRTLHQGLRNAARELRSDRAAPRQVAPALDNVAAGIRVIEEGLTPIRATLARMIRFRQAGLLALFGRVGELDGQLDRELEKDVLYLEQLFDKQRADDLVRMARDLASRRRDLANLLEAYRKAPDEAKKKDLLAEVARMKARMGEMMRRMAELAKGIDDEHMNQEALAEMAKSKDAMAGMDEVEKRLAAGDVEGAMRALDQLGNSMQQMLAALERTAGRPGEQNAELMKQMLAFKKKLEEVQGQQQQLAGETEQVRAEYRKRLAQKLKSLEFAARDLERLVADARQEVEKAEKGVSMRSEEDYAQARDRLRDLEKALQARDFDAALETARRTIGPMQRLSVGLEDDAFLAEHYPQLHMKDGRVVREAQRHAAAALGPTRKVKDELEKMFPDPRGVLSQKDQEKLDRYALRQGELERQAGDLRRMMEELAQRAPVFPPQAGDMIGGSQGHMQRAQGELAQRNPQRGHGEQRQALDDLDRFRRGLDQMAKSMKGAGGAGGGFPFPFGEEQGSREGDGSDPSREKVEIPGADAYKVPDEFRKDLLEAMKQGVPDPYKGDVQHYYEELVK